MAVGRHHRTAGGEVAREAIGVHTYQQVRAGVQVAQEDVRRSVGIAGNEIASTAFKQGILRVGRQTNRQRIPVASPGAGEIAAHQRGGAIRPVPQEDIKLQRKLDRHRRVVAVAHQVVRQAGEKHVAAVGANGRGQRAAATADRWRLCGINGRD